MKVPGTGVLAPGFCNPTISTFVRTAISSENESDKIEKGSIRMTHTEGRKSFGDPRFGEVDMRINRPAIPLDPGITIAIFVLLFAAANAAAIGGLAPDDS